jgi:hypothetical protein
MIVLENLPMFHLIEINMKIRFMLIGFTAITFMFLLESLNSALAVEYLNFTSDKYGIQFEYPMAWQIKEKAGRFDPGPEIEVSPSLNTIINIFYTDDLTKGYGTTDLRNAVYKSFREIMTDYRNEHRAIEDPSFLKIGGKEAGTFLTTSKDKYEDYASTWGIQNWIVFDNNHGYLISFMTTTDIFDNPENIEIRDHFIKSIKFTSQNSTASLGQNSTSGAGNSTSTSTTNRFDTSNNSAFEGTSNNSTFEDYQNKYCPPMSLVLCAPPDGGPRCPSGYHRSPDGDCEPARDVPPELGK